jgi:hypothetical protein
MLPEHRYIKTRSSAQIALYEAKSSGKDECQMYKSRSAYASAAFVQEGSKKITFFQKSPQRPYPYPRTSSPFHTSGFCDVMHAPR